MSASIETLGIDHLSVRERLDLIEQIWNSLPEEVDSQELPKWHLTELEQRLASAIADPGAGKPWREVLDAIASKS